MSDYEFHTLKDFSGGQNTTDAPDELLENQLIVCENVDFTGHGGVKPRKGITYKLQVTGDPFQKLNETALSTTNNTPTKYYEPQSTACLYRLLELERNTQVDGVPETNITRLALTNTFSSYGHSQFVVLPDDNTTTDLTEPLYGVIDNGLLIEPDGTEGYFSEPHLAYEIYKTKAYILAGHLGNSIYNFYLGFDGTHLFEAKSTPEPADSNRLTIRKCKYIAQRGERMFLAGNPDDPNALYFSEVGEPTYFKADNVIQAISDDGDIITGIKEFHGALLVFKSRSVYAWFGYDPYTDVEFQRLAVHTGTEAYRTIQQVGNYLFYLGNDGVYALQGTYKDVIITKKISTQINKLFDNKVELMYPHRNSHWFNPACAVYYDNKYMITAPEIVYDEYIMNNVPANKAFVFVLPFPVVSTTADLKFEINLFGTQEFITNAEYYNRYNDYAVQFYDVSFEYGDRTVSGGAFRYGIVFIVTSIECNLKIKFKRVKVNNIAVLDTTIAQDVFSADYLPWTIYKGLDVSEFLKSCDGNLYVALRGSTSLYKFDDVYSDVGQPINVNVETKPLSMGAYAHNKKFKNLYMTFAPLTDVFTEIDVEAKVDDSDSLFSVPWYDQKEKTLLRRLVVNKKGKRIKYKYSYACNGNPVILLGLTTQYKIKKPARG